jgi:hypothetical protein
MSLESTDTIGHMHTKLTFAYLCVYVDDLRRVIVLIIGHGFDPHSA